MPYRNAVGTGLRQRRLSGRARSGGRASPTGRGSRRGGPRRGGAAAIAGSAWPTTSSSTPASARARAHHRAARGRRRPGARHALVRSGPRDELRAAPGRVARRGARRGAADHRRHRRHRGRRRRPLGARAAARRGGDGEGVGSDRRQGPAHRRVDARGGGGRRRVLRATVPREGHRPLGRPLRRGARRGSADAPPMRAGRSTA